MSLLAADVTLIHMIPGYAALDAKLAHMFGMTYVDKEPVHTVIHLTLSLLAIAFIGLLVMVTRASWAKSQNNAIPGNAFSIPNVVETLMDGVLGLGEQVLGTRKEAERFFPLIGALAFYILFHNLLGLVPGMLPPTDTLNVTLGPAIVIFLVTHYVGLKAQGTDYILHFLGPKIGGVYLLAPLMVLIELISHAVRPVSLALRLMGNMTGDHKVIALFLGLVAVPLFYPVPVLALGTIVCTVQTLVFCLLSLVYIALAIEHSDEAH
ncbi:MAG: F-type H+-transporting ATPase subunit a [Bradymonadia bacterium]|jgi:F-type H+-transporting ATPase subunit a